MNFSKAKLAPGQYHIKEFQLQSASDADLQNWSTDPNCLEREDAAKHLVERAERKAAIEAASQKAELERINARILRRDADQTIRLIRGRKSLQMLDIYRAVLSGIFGQFLYSCPSHPVFCMRFSSDLVPTYTIA